jgi:hypothetical protein
MQYGWENDENEDVMRTYLLTDLVHISQLPALYSFFCSSSKISANPVMSCCQFAPIDAKFILSG